MPKLIGWIDVLLRKPMLVVTTASGKKFTGVVDTGFNRELWMDWGTAKSLGVKMLATHPRATVLTAGNQPVHTDVGELDIAWVSGRRRALVYIHALSGGPPDVLIGTGLLHPYILTVEFANDLVRIDP